MAIQYNQSCAIAKALELVGERWTLIIVKELVAGAKKFQELRKELKGIASNMLSNRLKQMEEEGIVERRIYSQHPLRAEYLLTEKGHGLEKVLLALGTWSLEYGDYPIERVHRGCGHHIRVVVECPHCEQELRYSETEVRLKSKKS